MTHEWYYEQFENHTRLGMQVRRHLVSEQSEFQKIELFEAERYGRVLALDGVYQTSELEEYFYHEMLVHPAMTSAPNIRRALVIGGGDGGTAREVLKHPEVEQCVMVEIDARVVEACKAHLPTIGTAWDDPRLELAHRRRHRVREGSRHRAVRRDLPRRQRPHRPEHRPLRRGVLPGLRPRARARRHLRPAERIAVPDARHLPPDPGDARPGVRSGGSRTSGRPRSTAADYGRGPAPRGASIRRRSRMPARSESRRSRATTTATSTAAPSRCLTICAADPPGIDG